LYKIVFYSGDFLAMIIGIFFCLSDTIFNEGRYYCCISNASVLSVIS
jgi:hypothetical protein